MQIQRRVPTFVAVSDLSPIMQCIPYRIKRKIKIQVIMLLDLICGDGRKRETLIVVIKRVTDGQTDRCSIRNNAVYIHEITTRSYHGKLH